VKVEAASPSGLAAVGDVNPLFAYDNQISHRVNDETSRAFVSSAFLEELARNLLRHNALIPMRAAAAGRFNVQFIWPSIWAPMIFRRTGYALIQHESSSALRNEFQ